MTDELVTRNRRLRSTWFTVGLIAGVLLGIFSEGLWHWMWT